MSGVVPGRRVAVCILTIVPALTPAIGAAQTRQLQPCITRVIGQVDDGAGPADTGPAQVSQTPPNAEPLPKGKNLATDSGFEFGGEISDYRYQEHVVASTDFMNETGAKFGITATGTKLFGSGFFVAGDFRFAYSSNDYWSPQTGTKPDIPDYLWDIRLLVGKDFLAENVLSSNQSLGISPYVGIGYRNLFNDLRAEGPQGYRRDSQYFYLPVGGTLRFRITDHARISSNLEYDQLLLGWQTSYLSDVSSRFPNTESDQHGGHGVRGNLMYERAYRSAGPFFNYWNIDRSALGNHGGYEPHNQTIEYGIQARYRF